MKTTDHYIFYYCQITALSSHNSGVQRTTRLIAKAMIQNGINLIPVGLDGERLFLLKPEDLEVMAKYNGPKVNDWFIPKSVEDYTRAKTLFITDLVSHPHVPGGTYNAAAKLINYAHNTNLKIFFLFYDALPCIFPQFYSEDLRKWHLQTIKDLANADGIIHISETTSNDFNIYSQERHYIKSTNMITLLLPNVFNEFKKVPAKENTSKEVTMLMVSTLEPRKNHIRALKAYKKAVEKLKSSGINLKFNIVGSPQDAQEIMQEVSLLRKNLDITLHGIVSEEKLLKLYSEADFTIFPSIYEGYGLPVSESLYLNTPVICSNNSSVKEVSIFGGCLTFNPFDEDDMCSAIVKMAADSDFRQSKIEELKTIPEYNWNDYARDCINFMMEEE